VTPVEFHEDDWHYNTRIFKLLCGLVCVIRRLAFLVELRLVTRRRERTDRRRTDTGSHHIPR